MTDKVLTLENITKSFGNIRALDGVTLAAERGRVLALLGDNGAGKSTLIKVISGVHRIGGGQIRIDGEPVSIQSVRHAINLGIETIHQDSTLAVDLSIARNLFLGREPTRAAFLGMLAPLDLPTLKRQASALLRRVGISQQLDADAPVKALSGGERQSIAISRAMQFFAKIIILDEPTNNLGVEETNGVLRFIREVRDAGHTVVFVTHNIHHVFQVSDRIAVMRQGRVVAEMDAGDTDVMRVESLITGADVEELAGEVRNG